MIIAMDYDDTWTVDPSGWYRALKILKDRGHKIYGVTMRYPHEASGMQSLYDEICDELIFTSRKAKRLFLFKKGIDIDVWIDDSPDWISNDAK